MANDAQSSPSGGTLRITYGLLAGVLCLVLLWSFPAPDLAVSATQARVSATDDHAKAIPCHLQKKVLDTCNRAVQQGLMAPVGALDRATLIALVGASSDQVRAVAVYTLGEIRCSEATATLIALLGDPDPTMRRVAAHALGKIGGEKVVGPLADLINDRSQPIQVRCTAARALGCIGGRHSAKVLQQVVRHDSGQVQSAAMVALHSEAMIIPAKHPNAVDD
ncbi:HEAT repeat domain-containing protein [Desulfoferula mesophila]|uniref:PBS lyase HEAT domain protein repeat-containing protein n=1 Tax=Desulfoferula mesophila TaxID=3058419 RepID=A0AAU9EFN9_9BACT|nr:hypothetical protein FAK_23730 [Desulfoferula mesophilus]